MKLKIGYATYAVVPMSVKESDKEHAWGMIDPQEQTIKILHTLPPHEQARILIHEITHGLFDLFQTPRRLVEEEVCQLVDKGFATVFLTNPEVLGVIHQALCNNVPIVRAR